MIKKSYLWQFIVVGGIGGATIIQPMYCEYLDKNRSGLCQQLQPLNSSSEVEKIADYVRHPNTNFDYAPSATTVGTANASLSNLNQ
ncbi:MAG: hypothetical protein ABID04_03670, partial [Patescibacteria group bacterium]